MLKHKFSVLLFLFLYSLNRVTAKRSGFITWAGKPVHHMTSELLLGLSFQALQDDLSFSRVSIGWISESEVLIG